MSSSKSSRIRHHRMVVYWLLSLLVLPLYVPTLIFGAEAVRRGADGLDATGALLLLGAITAGGFALLPFATAAVLRINLR